jgi:NAD(P)H dehydrogenase (quinone)
MILVTGATGHFGTATIQFLLEKGIPANHIVALVRDENKAKDLKNKGVEIRVGDYLNYDSLVAAFKGIDQLLLVSSNDLSTRSEQQINAVNAAKEAGVKQLIYTSFERKNETATSPISFVAQSHLDTENHIKKSSIPYTILRNNLYTDMIPMFVGEKVLETGVFFPAGTTPVAFATRNDMAEATANILIGEGHDNKTYAFSGTEQVSFQDIAHTISKLSEKEVVYNSPTVAVYTDALTGAGVPELYINMFAGFGEAIHQGEFNNAASDLEQLLGRKPATVNEFLTGVYSLKH